MGVATLIDLNGNGNACNYDRPLPNMLKLHCMVLVGAQLSIFDQILGKTTPNINFCYSHNMT